MTASGYSPEYVADRMELWEARIALQGLIWRDLHLLNALRLNGALIASQWSSSSIQPTDLARYPWDELEEQADEADATSWSAEETIARSEGLLDGITIDTNG